MPAAAHILNFVVLTAAISVYNSAIYSNSRMLYGLAGTGEAPAFFRKLSPHGVPVRGILVSSGITLIVVALNYFLQGHVFMYLMMIATCAAVISWVVICITHLKFRAYCQAHGKQTKFHAILYPWANYLSLLFLAGVSFLYRRSRICSWLSCSCRPGSSSSGWAIAAIAGIRFEPGTLCPLSVIRKGTIPFFAGGDCAFFKKE